MLKVIVEAMKAAGLGFIIAVGIIAVLLYASLRAEAQESASDIMDDMEAHASYLISDMIVEQEWAEYDAMRAKHNKQRVLMLLEYAKLLASPYATEETKASARETIVRIHKNAQRCSRRPGR